MTPERWREVTQIYGAVVSRAPEQRAAAVAELCGSDADLRREIESLLHSQHGASLLERPASDRGAVTPCGVPIGSHIGVFRIDSLLGVGGMGEVYRARDTKLNRDVAIKILPPAFANDADRLARFKREAQVLASLNHPNIAAIHGFEDSSSVHALVLELVEGPTLADRIARGRLETSEALAIAKQIADALEAAHEQGVIHRDLKPANVKVREDGTVKVLDFGLAKLVEGPGGAEGPHHDRTNSPTMTTPAMTQAGMILGTAAYMSPEQAKGKPADKRSDIWAFGCVLYEMLTGTRAFEGDDVADTLANVLKIDPNWEALPTHCPAALRTLLQRCLTKDRHRRIADMAAAQFVLAEMATFGSVPQSRDQARHLERATTRVIPLAAAVLVTGLLVGAGAWLMRPAIPTPTPVRFSIPLQEREELTPNARQILTISPDGTEVVYAATNRLIRRSLADMDTRLIAGVDVGNLSLPVFSPDGRWIAFFSTFDNSIKRIASNGGSPTLIRQLAAPPMGMSWTGESILFGMQGSGIFRVSPNGGEPEQLIVVDRDTAAYGPQLLPDGDSVLFTIAKGTEPDRWDRAQVVVQSIKSKERAVVINGGSDARYLPTGHLIYAQSGSLMAVRFDARTKKAIGDRVSVVAGVRRAFGFNSGGSAHFAVSATGALVYLPGPLNPLANLRLLVVSDQVGPGRVLKPPAGPYVHPRVSPDGTQLAVGVDDGREANVWVYDLAETTALRRLTLKGRNRYPVWSWDGRRIAFESDALGEAGILWQRADGAGAVERLTTASKDVEQIPEAFSPDGKYLLFVERKNLRFVLHTLSLGGKTSRPFGGVASVQPISSGFSPDGRWVTYAVTEQSGGELSPTRGVFIQPFPATGAVYPVPKMRIDYHPVWARNGRTIFFVSTVTQPIAMVPVKTSSGISFGSPTLLPSAVPRPALLSFEPRGYDVTPNGNIVTSVAASDQESLSGVQRLDILVVLNWLEELQQKVPTR